MKNKALIAFVISFIFFVLIDILLWQRIFEVNKLWQYTPQYKTAQKAILMMAIITGIVAIGNAKEAVWFAFAMWMSWATGLGDVLYYVLDKRNIPDILPWLSDNVYIIGYDKINLIVSVLFWQVLIFVAYFAFVKGKE